MKPVELDGNRILVIDGIIGQKTTNTLIQGTAQFDGECFKVISDKNEQFIIPEKKWDLVEVPITGRWKRVYPKAKYYIVYT